MKRKCKWLIAILLLWVQVPPLQAALKPEHVVVVYNAQSAFSKECALSYAKTRKVPENNLLPLDMGAVRQDITHDEYQRLICEPLRDFCEPRQLQFAGDAKVRVHPIYAMVLMPDLPLRIKPSPVKAGAKSPHWSATDAASVDSELASIGTVVYRKSGMRRNEYFMKSESLPDAGYKLISVCRIDSPSKSVTRRMITQPTKLEASGGLRGTTVVDWGGPHAQGDTWMKGIAKRAYGLGHPIIIHPLKSVIEQAYPMPQMCAVYFGWYGEHASGPFSASQKRPFFRFAPGAVAVHLHSFSATSISETNAWVGPLLMKGADVTAGNVWEPYLGGSLYLDVFHERLLKGYCVAEAALMATPAVSWQGLVLGDPLYRPFAKVQRGSSSAESRAHALFLDEKYSEAQFAFAKLHKEAKDEASLMRAALGCVQALLLRGHNADAKSVLTEILQHEAQSPYIGAAKEMMQRYFPAPKPQNGQK